MATAPGTAPLKQLMRAHLLADSAVSALVGPRVYGVHLEDADAETVLQDGPLVVYELLSGSLRWHGAVAVQTLEVYGYSKRSADEASQVYDAVTDALQHECLNVPGIGVTAIPRETQRPLDGFNTVLRGWFVRGRWTLEVV
jgi:hypothetical protein